MKKLHIWMLIVFLGGFSPVQAQVCPDFVCGTTMQGILIRQVTAGQSAGNPKVSWRGRGSLLSRPLYSSRNGIIRVRERLFWIGSDRMELRLENGEIAALKLNHDLELAAWFKSRDIRLDSVQTDIATYRFWYTAHRLDSFGFHVADGHWMRAFLTYDSLGHCIRREEYRVSTGIWGDGQFYADMVHTIHLYAYAGDTLMSTRIFQDHGKASVAVKSPAEFGRHTLENHTQILYRFTCTPRDILMHARNMDEGDTADTYLGRIRYRGASAH